MALIIVDTVTNEYLKKSRIGDNEWVTDPNLATRFYDLGYGKLWSLRYEVRYLSELN